MIDQPSVGFTRYEEGGTSTMRWIKVEGTHTCKVIMRYDMGCQYLYCSGQQILYRDELYQKLNTKDPKFIEGIYLQRGVCSAVQSVAMSGFLVHEVCDDKLRRISEFSSFSFFVDNIVDRITPGHIKNCRNCKRNYESKEHGEQSTKKLDHGLKLYQK